MEFELNRITLHTILYIGKDAVQYFKNMQQEEQEDEDESYEDKIIRESLRGSVEQEFTKPVPHISILRIDPREVYSESQTFSLDQNQVEDPVFDNTELTMKNGDTHVIVEPMDEYIAIRKAYFEWEKTQTITLPNIETRVPVSTPFSFNNPQSGI